ncbi:helix-turn-helix domain-containing protein [Actinomadura sp. 3N508]|uniref:helix-turn-helix domain-containing protein n=1 Tax=Actinomadura sp. 3N508 TaxID=3375153 RepID=UPI0037A4D189
MSALLADLKQRSGLSYQELARRTFTSRAALHRYCGGERIPADYAVVVAIAKECGAGPEELNELLRYWNAAAAESPSAEPAAESAVMESPAVEPAAVSPPAGRSGVLRWARGTPMWLLLASALLLGLIGGPVRDLSGAGEKARAAPPRTIPAPSWATEPYPVPRTMFGVTVNSGSGAMPSFLTGGVRLWDGGTRWASLETSRGDYDWTTLDRLLDGARKAGLPTLFVLGGTPAWAAPAAPRAAYSDGSRAAPPDDLRDWDRFIDALARHARGRIDAYELWVMANDPHFYNGSVETLVEMTRRAARIVRRYDAEAELVCPSMSRLWEAEGRRVLARFAELGGYRHCTAAGVKLYQPRAVDPPELMLQALELADREFHRAGVHPEIWNTGTTYNLPLQTKPATATAADYAARFYLTGLYAHRYNLRRMYLYAWGSDRVPIVLQPEGGPPTRAALNVERLQRWLADAEIRACGHGVQSGLPHNVWQCEFRVRREGRRDTVFIRWAHEGEAWTSAGPRPVTVEQLDGTVRTVPPGGMVKVTQSPLLIG